MDNTIARFKVSIIIPKYTTVIACFILAIASIFAMILKERGHWAHGVVDGLNRHIMYGLRNL